MNKDLEIWKFAAESLRRGESVTMLIVAESSGSSPGREGFKMAVAGDEMCGSVGGGVMEVGLVQSAKRKVQSKNNRSEIRNPKSEIIEQVHRKNSPDASGMICSGKQTVIFFKLNFSHLKTVLKIIDALENNQTKKLKITNHKLQIANLTSEDADLKFERDEKNEFIYEEKLGFKNKLIIIGGGHCALALSEIMSKMDFYISLFDDRAKLNTVEKNKFVNEKKIIDSYENIADFVADGKNVYTVVMTLGYKFDEIVIRKLFDKSFKYFGVLGSKAKMKTLLKNLEEEGFDKEKLSRIHTPIGLQINSRTPEEIAVSIAAEIIAVKNSNG